MEKRAHIDHQLLLAQAGWVRGLAGSLVRDPLGAEDVAQETLLAALASPGLRVDDERTLRAWLARVVTNLSRLSVRGNARRRSREQTVARSERIPSTSETVERASQLQGVVEAVLALDEPYRSTVLLRFFEGLGYEEIGRRTGASAVTVRKRLSRGLERLRNGLDEEFNGEREAWRAAFLPLAGSVVPEGLAGWAPGTGAVPAAQPAAAAPWAGAALQATAVVLAALTLSGLSTLVPRTPQADLRTAEPGDAPVLELVAVRPLGRRPAPRPSLAATAVDPGPASPPARAPVQLDPGEDPEVSTPDAPPAERVTGRVLGMDGTGLGGLEVLVAGRSRVVAHSGIDGSFEAPLESLRGPDETSAGRAFTVRRSGLNGPERSLAVVRGTTPPSGTEPDLAEHLIVVAPAIELGGWITEPGGAPVGGAELRFVATDGAFADLWVPLDRTDPVAYSATTDASGHFAFETLPTHPGFELEVVATGHPVLRIPVPRWSRGDLELRLGTQLEERLVEGLVVLPGGIPAVGALVRAGGAETRTDHAGVYRLRLDPARAPRTIVADLEGWQPADDALGDFDSAVDGSTGGVADQGPELMLPGLLLDLPGLALDPQGLPAEGWTVSAYDDQVDPRHPERPRGGLAARATVDAGGRFVLEGLLDRDYRLMAVDPAGAHHLGPYLAAAGRSTVLDPGPGLRGEERRQGLARTAVRSGGARTAGHEGGLAGGSLRGPVDGQGAGKGQVGPQVTAAAVTGKAAGPVAALLAQPEPEQAWFVFAGGPFEPAPDAMVALDAYGSTVELVGPSGPLQRMHLPRGRSPVVSVGEHAQTLVLFHRGQELARLPLRLLPGELTVVSGWSGPRGLGNASVSARRVRGKGLGQPGGDTGVRSENEPKKDSSPVTNASSRQP